MDVPRKSRNLRQSLRLHTLPTSVALPSRNSLQRLFQKRKMEYVARLTVLKYEDELGGSRGCDCAEGGLGGDKQDS